MPTPKPYNWDDVRVFAAIARHNSIQKAADELRLNYTTAMRRIKTLEADWNVLLLEKTKTGYRLTSNAKQWLTEVEELEKKHQRLYERVCNTNDELNGIVTLTTTNSLYHGFLAPLITEFKVLQPDISINVDLSLEPQDLSNNQADIAIRMTNSPPENLAGKKLVDIEFGVYTTKGIVECKKTPLILWDKDSNPESWATQLFSEFEEALTFNDLGSILDAVSKGLGAALLPKLLVQQHLSNDLITLKAPNNLPTYQLWLLFRPEHRDIKRIKCLKDFLAEKLSSFIVK